jgi:type IVB pilus formation R64 PilN family outer membrane protein
MQATVKLLLTLLLAGLAGCAQQLIHDISDEQRILQLRAEEAQTLARQKQVNASFLIEETTPKFASRSVVYHRIDALPSNVGKVTMRLPGRHSLSAIAEMLERLVDIPVTLSSDALLDASLFTPGAAVIPPTAEKLSEAMQANEDIKQRATKAGASSSVSFTDRELRHTLELNYSGTLTGLLDHIAARAGLQWQFQGGRIAFTRVVTRALSVKALSGGLRTTGALTMGTGISSTSSAESDIWPMLDQALKNMISARGRLQVDAKSGTITVTDAVQNVETIARFIELQNDTMLRQIVLDVEVLQVDLTQEHASGIDWSIVSNGLGAAGVITAGSGSIMKPYSGADPGSIQSVVSRNDGGGVKTLITALEQFGRVSSSYSTVVVTTNRQPVPFGVQNSEAYLASVTAGTVNAVTGVSTGATLTASSVSTGFSMVLVPLIMDSNRILIESTMQISALREMKNFSSGSGNAANSIQLPNVDSYNTLQRVSVAAGDTIVMSGFEREVTLRDEIDVVRNTIPGSRRGRVTKQSTVILITPRLQR